MDNVLKALDEKLAMLAGQLDSASHEIEYYRRLVDDQKSVKAEYVEVLNLLRYLHEHGKFSLETIHQEMGAPDNYTLNRYLNGYTDLMKEFK